MKVWGGHSDYVAQRCLNPPHDCRTEHDFASIQRPGPARTGLIVTRWADIFLFDLLRLVFISSYLLDSVVGLQINIGAEMMAVVVVKDLSHFLSMDPFLTNIAVIK